MLYSLIVAVITVLVCLWQDGVNDCNDGVRYCSKTQQPSPFHRRFHYWPKRPLQAISLLSMVGIGVSMRDPYRAAMLLSLPGAVFITTHPTCTDAPSMLLAWLSSLLMSTHPALGVAMSCAAGVMHERAPVYAAVYAMSPWPLLGLLAVQWWAKPAKRDTDKFVGDSFLGQIRAHKPYTDLLDPWTVVYGYRCVLPMAVYYGASPRAWFALALSFGSRIIGTDACRFLYWAAPPMIADTQVAPAWIVMVHLLTFRRAA